MAGAPPEEGCSGLREIVQIWTISGGGRQARTAARAAIATRPTRPGSGRACPVVSRTPGGQVFTRANQPPGRDGGDSPRFGKNLTVPTAHVHTGTSRVHRVGGATFGAFKPTPAGRSVCTLSAGRPVLHQKQSACSALRLGRLPGARRPWGDELDPIVPGATLRFRWPGMSAAEYAMAARLKIVQPWERGHRNSNVAVPAGLTASPNLTDVDIHGFWKGHAEISYGPITISCDGK